MHSLTDDDDGDGDADVKCNAQRYYVFGFESTRTAHNSSNNNKKYKQKIDVRLPCSFHDIFPPELGVDIHVVILFNFFLSLLRFLMIFFYLVVFLFFNAFRKKGSFFSRISSKNGSK